MQCDVLRQDIRGDGSDNLLVRAGQVRAGLADQPLFPAYSVLVGLILGGRRLERVLLGGRRLEGLPLEGRRLGRLISGEK